MVSFLYVIEVDIGMQIRPTADCKLFGVILINATKAPKLPFRAIKVAMVIRIGCNQFGLSNMVNGFNFLQYLNRKWQMGGPWPHRPPVVACRGLCHISAAVRH